MAEETRSGAGLTCPYCGHVNRDSWEVVVQDDVVETECGECEKPYMARVYVDVDYIAEPIEGVA